jgi:AcrR family transcriptional regulator
MASRAKDARAARSSAALRDAMLKLLLEAPFDQITVRDICAEANVHYATFFRHFAGKEALLDDIAAKQISTLVDLTLPIQQVAGHAVAIRKLFDYIEAHRALWATLLNGGAAAAMRNEWLHRAQLVTDIYRGSQSWLPKELGILSSVALIIETVTWWLRQPEGSCSSDSAAEILSRLLSSILATD